MSNVGRSIPDRNAFLSIVEGSGAALVARRQERCKKAVNCGAKKKIEGRDEEDEDEDRRSAGGQRE